MGEANELSNSLKEAIAHAKGELKLRETAVDSNHPELTPEELKRAKPTKSTEIKKQEPPTGIDTSKLKEPIWPMSDEDLVKWKKWMKDAPKRVAEQKEIDKENARVKKLWENVEKPKLVAELRELQDQVNAKRPGRKKGSKVKKTPKTYDASDKPRQQRLGQTKLIDELLDKGMNDTEIFKQVQEEIPEYPKEKLSKLIKLRKYHQKKI